MELHSVEKARFWVKATPDLLESKALIKSQGTSGAQRDLYLEGYHANFLQRGIQNWHLT